MSKKELPRLAQKIKDLRAEQGLTQKELAKKARISESALRSYELGDRNPKPEILARIAKALGVRPEYLSAPVFKNEMEFAYALLENEGAFGYSIVDANDSAFIGTGSGTNARFFSDLIRSWNDMRKKLDAKKITRGEYESWKRTWDNRTWVDEPDGKSPWTGK